MAEVREPLTPFSGKLIWGLLILGGLFIVASIIAYYGMESGAWMWLAFVAAGPIIAHFWIKKLNRDRAKRLAELEYQDDR